MRFNPDCAREIVLFFEGETTGRDVLQYSGGTLAEASSKLGKFSPDELRYHVVQCAESGFFVNFDEDMSGHFWLTDLSPIGHQFAGKVRNDTVWKKFSAWAKEHAVDTIGAILEGIASVSAFM